MAISMLTRRNFLGLGVLAGLGALTSCSVDSNTALLTATKDKFPKEWLKELPAPWQFKPLKVQSESDPFKKTILEGADLIALGDGWLNTIPIELLQSIGGDQLMSRMDFQAQNFIRNLGKELSSCVIPIGVSPWVMVFRKGNRWISEAKESWQVLLDPFLKDQVILPHSPRVIMSIAEGIEKPNSLKKLRAQAKAFDDRNGLNWLLSGEGRVAVLPLKNCWNVLSRDPRLSVALPTSGAPLDWTVLVQSRSSAQPFPKRWLEKGLSMPLLGKLLSRGWKPPLPREELDKAIEFVPERYRSTLLPVEATWSNCWSFAPLNYLEFKELKNQWEQSSP